MVKRASTATGSPPGSLAPDTPAEFAAWLAPHVVRMSHLIARMAPAADVDDVLQDAMLAAWRSRRKFDASTGSVSSWLLAIAANAARKARRRRQPVLDGVPDRESAAVDSDLSVDIQRAVRELSRRQQLAVNCFYFADLTVAETAAVMRCSEGTVKSTLSAARRRLHPLLLELS
jgi:RNA polymerase sigma-70 factor (ECF subfamily)